MGVFTRWLLSANGTLKEQVTRQQREMQPISRSLHLCAQVKRTAAMAHTEKNDVHFS